MERLTRQKEHDTESENETTRQEGVRSCPECDSTTLTRSSNGSEISCEDCGLILEEETIDRGPEWRAFNAAERDNKSRVGAPTTQTMHDKGLTTTIDWKNQDAYGRSLSSEKRSQMNRLRKWQERIRTKDAGERNLQFALSETDRMASALGVPALFERLQASSIDVHSMRISSVDARSKVWPRVRCTRPAGWKESHDPSMKLPRFHGLTGWRLAARIDTYRRNSVLRCSLLIRKIRPSLLF